MPHSVALVVTAAVAILISSQDEIISHPGCLSCLVLLLLRVL
jgi:hypothetical protein